MYFFKKSMLPYTLYNTKFFSISSLLMYKGCGSTSSILYLDLDLTGYPVSIAGCPVTFAGYPVMLAGYMVSLARYPVIGWISSFAEKN